MAAETISPQLAAMSVLMAPCTFFFQAEESMIQVLDLDISACLGRNAHGRVTSLAL